MPHNRPGEPNLLCLAIESSNPSSHAEVGLGVLSDREARVLGVEALREVGRNEDDLLPAIDRLFARVGASPMEVRAVAVSIGPGGYTSLRVACAAGKLIAEAAGARCIGVPTALALARGVNEVDPSVRVGVALAGKDDSVYLTVFPPGGWRAGTALPAGELVRAASFPTGKVDVLVGDRYVPIAIRELLATSGIRIVEPRYSAAACMQVAPLLQACDPIELAPLYPREPDAVTLWRKRRVDDRNK